MLNSADENGPRTPVAPRNPLRPILRRIGTRRWLLRAAPAIIWFERSLRRLTGNRIGLRELGGVNIALLTVPGRKTGIPRTTPIFYVPHDRGFLVAGSNWGRVAHPAWSANLLAADKATVTVRTKEFAVTVHHVVGSQRDELWPMFVESWPGFALEADIAGSREFRIFLLQI